MSGRKKSPQSIDSRIVAAIHGRGRGSVFVPADFLEIGSREAVDVALHRLARQGTIRRLARGVYDFPKEHPVLGPLAPSAEDIARALAGRDRTRLQPAGAYAANALGLSEQVPAKVVFLTDGPARTVKIGSTTILTAAEARREAKRLKAEITLGADPRAEAKARKVGAPDWLALFLTKKANALQGSRKLPEAIKAATESLGQVIQKIGASVYQQPEAGGPQAGPSSDAGPDVVDGEVKE